MTAGCKNPRHDYQYCDIFLSCNIYYDKPTHFLFLKFKHSGMEPNVIGCLVPDISEDHSAFIFRVKQSNLKCQELLTLWHSIIHPEDLHGQQHRVKTSNLANCPLCWQLLLCTVTLHKPTCLVLQTSYTEVFPDMGITQQVMVLLIIFKSWPHIGRKISGSHSGAGEDSRLLQCDAVTLGGQFMTFQRRIVSASLG